MGTDDGVTHYADCEWLIQSLQRCLSYRDELRLKLDKCSKQRDALLETMRQIAKREGRFDRDPWEHSLNCVTHMAELAETAIAACEEGKA